jgi:hypothetical protein
MTHTYAILKVSRAAYAEIRALLVRAGYMSADHGVGSPIDMHGIALAAAPSDSEADTECSSGLGCWLQRRGDESSAAS